MPKSLSSPANVGFTKHIRQRHACQCASLRPFTTSTSHRDEQRYESELYGNRGRELREGPRWDTTPPRMMAPVRSKPPVLDNDFVVNRDPQKLDMVYNRVLGRDGDKMLSEEVKWLAVTHKSFDHGRRGFNDRLAYLGMGGFPWIWDCRIFAHYSISIGRQIVGLQSSLALIHKSTLTDPPPARDEYGREPFDHTALYGLRGLTSHTKWVTTERDRLAQLATRYGIDGVVRWKPKRVRSMGINLRLIW